MGKSKTLPRAGCRVAPEVTIWKPPSSAHSRGPLAWDDDVLEREAKRVKDETLRKAKLPAIQQCRNWLDLPWADMLTPVKTKLTEVKPPLENKSSSTREDTACLQRARAVYAVYVQFYQKIYPTAHHASVERSIREQEKAQRKA